MRASEPGKKRLSWPSWSQRTRYGGPPSSPSTARINPTRSRSPTWWLRTTTRSPCAACTASPFRDFVGGRKSHRRSLVSLFRSSWPGAMIERVRGPEHSGPCDSSEGSSRAGVDDSTEEEHCLRFEIPQDEHEGAID